MEGYIDDPWFNKTKEKWLVWLEIQRCMNPECATANRYRYLPGKLSYTSPYHPDDLKKHRLKGADLKKFKKGEHDSDGVFKLKNKKGHLEPMEIIPPEYNIHVEHEGVWAWIWPGDLRDEIPDTWTLKDDWIKTRLSSRRYTEITQWFAARRVNLDELLEPDNDDEDEGKT